MPQFYDRHGVLQQGDITAQMATDRARWQADVRQRQSAAWRRKAFRTAAGGAALFGGGAALSSFAGAGAGAGAATGADMTAAATSPGWWNPALRLGGFAAGTFGNIYASRQNTRANRDAIAAQERQNALAMQLEREQIEEARRQHEADERFRAAQWASQEEERLYRRRLDDEREARRAPFRRASTEALARIPGILASGRTSPGMGSLGSYRR